MKRIVDIARALFVSPELLCLVLPVAIWSYWPGLSQFMATQVSSDLKWGFGVVMVPLGLLAACYKLGTDLLAPHGARKVLLEWPDYFMLKDRVVLALVFCALAFVIALIGFYFVAVSKSSLGMTFVVSGCLSAAAALATVALSWWRSREILGE